MEGLETPAMPPPQRESTERTKSHERQCDHATAASGHLTHVVAQLESSSTGYAKMNEKHDESRKTC